MILPLLLLLLLSVPAFSPPSTQGVAPAQRLIPKSVFKGGVYNPAGLPVAGAKVFSGMDSAITNLQGNFRMEIPVPDTGGIFPAVVKANGYFVKWVSVKLVPGDTTFQNFTIVYPNFRMRVSVDFRPKSARVKNWGNIDEAIRFLKDYPDLTVEIAGFCYEWKSRERALRTSQLMADAVRREIIKRGAIDPSRIVAKGHGLQFISFQGPHPKPPVGTRIDLRVLQ